MAPSWSLRNIDPVHAVKQPEHPVGPAFEQARDRVAFLEARLLEDQKARYQNFVKGQEKEKEEQKQKAARAKAEYDQAKEKSPRLVKNYDPPVKIKDPYLKKMALDAQAEHHKVTTLGQSQLEDRLKVLENLDQEREKQAAFRENAQHITRSRASPEFTRAAASERPAPPGQEFNRAAGSEKDNALSRAFEKAKAQQDQTRQRTQTQEHGRTTRERSPR